MYIFKIYPIANRLFYFARALLSCTKAMTQQTDKPKSWEQNFKSIDGFGCTYIYYCLRSNNICFYGETESQGPAVQDIDSLT